MSMPEGEIGDATGSAPAAVLEITAVQVNSMPVSLLSALQQANMEEHLEFIAEAVDTALIGQYAAGHGIEVDADEIQAAADNFRTERKLTLASAFMAWLKAGHHTMQTWQTILQDRIVRAKVRTAVTEGGVDRYFAEHRPDFDTATVSIITVAEEDLAWELRAQIIDDEQDFHALARAHSIDGVTRPAGGYAGPVVRKDLPAEVESAVFGTKSGTVVGPMRWDRRWRLIKVESIKTAILDEATRNSIEDRLFNHWLAEERRRAEISLPLLDLLG